MGLIKRELLEARPVELGKIKIGERGKPNKGGKSYLPKKLDHFLVTTMEREGGDGPFVRNEAVHSHPEVGDEPRELFGTLMYPTVEGNFHSEMTHYEGRRQVSSCDGCTRTITATGESVTCSRLRGGDCPCKPYGRLQIQLDAQPEMGGFFVFRTTSWASVNNIQTALEQIYREFGTLYRAPVKLFMQKTEDKYTNEKGEDVTSSSWKVGLVLRMSPTDARRFLKSQAQEALQTRKELLLESGVVQAALGAADLEEAEEIAEEFFPEGVEAVEAPETDAAGAPSPVAAPDPVEGAEDEEEVQEAEYEVEEEDESPEAELTRLLKQYPEESGVLPIEGRKMCAQALFAGIPEHIEASIKWIREKAVQTDLPFGNKP